MRRFMTALALLLLLGGCSSTPENDQGVASANGNSSTAPTTSATEQAGTEEQMQKFAQCMRDNGVDMPDPEPGGGMGGGGGNIDRDSPAFQKAMDACRSMLPGGGDLSKLDPKLIDQLRALTQCLRDNGLEVPDPDPNSPTLGLGAMQNIDRNSPAFKKAMQACQDKVPGRLGG
ncbi:uncharacterized protein YceK [Kibdelosporangium banguiense]|uniref:Uncharacterized protein YceK n=1 Tax=Kibdelosporangium banguiense TaxID=1365924 RepID=A0ABS4THB9_9PSEU|nr:hypothetical protein [Kibdelosporangium banguiense]MBP2323830.1 uncharacterized protein YceK [Kibdelosporangium banguiense]